MTRQSFWWVIVLKRQALWWVIVPAVLKEGSQVQVDGRVQVQVQVQAQLEIRTQVVIRCGAQDPQVGGTNMANDMANDAVCKILRVWGRRQLCLSGSWFGPENGPPSLGEMIDETCGAQ